MELSQDTRIADQIITAYQADVISVSGIEYKQSLLVTPDHVYTCDLTALAQLQTDDIEQLLAKAPEVVLFGTDEGTLQLPPAQLTLFYEKNIGVEVMNVQAACRTYNLLANEGRRVLACLILPKQDL